MSIATMVTTLCPSSLGEPTMLPSLIPDPIMFGYQYWKRIATFVGNQHSRACCWDLGESYERIEVVICGEIVWYDYLEFAKGLTTQRVKKPSEEWRAVVVHNNDWQGCH